MTGTEGKAENPIPKDRKLRGKELRDAGVELRGELGAIFPPGTEQLTSTVVQESPSGGKVKYTITYSCIPHPLVEIGVGETNVEINRLDDQNAYQSTTKASVSIVSNAPDSICFYSSGSGEYFDNSTTAQTKIKKVFNEAKELFRPSTQPIPPISGV